MSLICLQVKGGATILNLWVLGSRKNSYLYILRRYLNINIASMPKLLSSTEPVNRTKNIFFSRCTSTNNSRISQQTEQRRCIFLNPSLGGEISSMNLQLITLLLKNLSSTQKHSNMGVVSTRMHLARNFTLVLPFNLFLNQSITY